MYVVMSAAIGAGNSIAFTYRDNASSQTLACTISGASAKTCSDITHSFTPSVGDQLAIQIVTTGTVVATPNIQVTTQYGAIGGGGGGGAIIHHDYYTAATTDNSGSGRAQMNGTGGTNHLTPVVGIQSVGTTVASNLIILVPSTWDGSAIILSADVTTSTNATGNYSFTPSYMCIPNGFDVGASPSYTSGSTITQAAPGGSGTGFYRESVAMSLTPTGCAGQLVQFKFTRGGADTYSDTMYFLGVDVAIKY
jgi:hypothetical protein